MKKIFEFFILVFFLLNTKGNAQGDSPCTATPVTINSGAVCPTYTAGTTVGATYSNNAANGGAPTCGSPGAPDVWYSFVAPPSGMVNIYTTAGSITDGAMQLYASSNNLCTGTLTAYNCDDDSGPGLMPQLALCGFTPGATYWLRLWQYGSGTGTFNICFWDPYVQDATTTANCAGGTQVCSNANFSGNGSGFGIQELNGCNRGCLAGNEHNSSWYWLNIGTSGNLEMTITPSNGSDDYDFAIWGPVNACPPAVAPVKCNYAAFPRAFGCGTNTNPTGMTAAGVGNSAAACANTPFLSPLAVTAGQVYILLIDGFTAAAQPFNLSWGGTAGLSCTPIVLPVELLSFTAQNKGNQNLVEWVTASEVNNDYFTIEKSKNAIDFWDFKNVKGAGMSTLTNTYKIYDETPGSGITYYRLKQTDYNGETKTYNVISVNSCTSECIDANAYSNEQGGLVVNIIETDTKAYTIKIFDALGNKLKSETIYAQKGFNSTALDINGLSVGIYFVSFENGKNTSTQKLFIKK